MTTDLTKRDIEKIIDDKIKSFIVNEFAKELKKELSKSGSPARDEMLELTRKALTNLAQFLWFKKDLWVNNVK